MDSDSDDWDAQVHLRRLQFQLELAKYGVTLDEDIEPVDLEDVEREEVEPGSTVKTSILIE